VDSPSGHSAISPFFGSTALNAVATIDHSGTTKIPMTIADRTTRTAIRPPRRAVSRRGTRSPRVVGVICPPSGAATTAWRW
jgi:hypothetical protein